MQLDNIKLFLSNQTNLCDDVMNMIVEYCEPTLKEQCLDPKSLKRIEKHKKFLSDYNYFYETNKKFNDYMSSINKLKSKLKYWQEFVLTSEHRVVHESYKNFSSVTIRLLYTHPKTKEQIVDLHFHIINLKNSISDEEEGYKNCMYEHKTQYCQSRYSRLYKKFRTYFYI